MALAIETQKLWSLQSISVFRRRCCPYRYIQLCTCVTFGCRNRSMCEQSPYKETGTFL